MQQFGLIGYPLEHSLSKVYFEQKFWKENLHASYELFPLESLTGLKSFIHSHPDLWGLNVTIPYKEKIISWLDDLDDTAGKIEAVNCISINRTGNKIYLKGHNTDVYGFENSLKPILDQLPSKALILGTGGASKAVAHVFDRLHIHYLFVSRKPHAANHISYEAIQKSILDEYRFIVNATPLGMFPLTGQYPDIPYQLLSPDYFLYDLIYNPAESLFLQKGKVAGAKTMNGLDMLHLQAEESWKIWNGKQ